MNGDLVTQANLGQVIDYHQSGDQALTMAVRKYFHQVPFGCVEVEQDELIGFVEKPTATQLINAGIYVLNPDCIDLVAPGVATSMPELISQIQARGRRVRVYEIDGDWIDIGRREQLDLARRGE
jgi:NDP-sugar pyrophosphorylase family protein